MNKCPKKKRQTEQESDAEDSGAEERHKFKCTKVLLNNQADVSVAHPDLLQDLQQAEKTVRINGAGGFQFETSTKGHLQDFFPVYANKKTTVNILSFSEVEEEYEITL